MSARHSSQLGIILVAALWSLPSVAMEASNKEAIRLLANEAASEYEAGHYNAALEKFQRAFDTAKVPRLAVSIFTHFCIACEYRSRTETTCVGNGCCHATI